jgi:hypothetical protein
MNSKSVPSTPVAGLTPFDRQFAEAHDKDGLALPAGAESVNDLSEVGVPVASSVPSDA